MKKSVVLHWLPVAANLAAVLVIVFFGLIPFNRDAGRRAREADAVAAELNQKLTVLTELPRKQSELDSLVRRLETFRRALQRTDRVNEVMGAFEQRAEAARVSFWTLDPSLPTLVSLDRSTDSVAALDLAMLPLRFECRGDFVSVGRFLESEQRRSEFCRWSRLIISPDGASGDVRASGDILLFLLPEGKFLEAGS